MRSPEGQDFWSAGVYQEIEEPGRLVVTDYFTDAEGNAVDPSVYGMSTWPAECRITTTFTEQDGRTRVSVVHAGLSSPLPEGDEVIEQCRQGWNECLDKLEAYLQRP
jgi:uncharacterized protein YndB with AHSA1/START domain